MSILRRSCFKIFKIYLLVLISGMQDIVKAFRCQKSRNPCYECISFIIVRSLLQLPVLISLQSSSIGNGMTYCRWEIALASFSWKRNCDKWLVCVNVTTFLYKNCFTSVARGFLIGAGLMETGRLKRIIYYRE